MERRFLVARFDVTGLSRAEMDSLEGHVVAQAEAADNDAWNDSEPSTAYPDVPVEIVYEGPDQGEAPARSVLLHLNVSIPAGDPRNARDIAEAIKAALTVGIEGAPDEMGLATLDVCVPLAEEI